MEAYTGFAEVYDILMDNVPYEDWAVSLRRMLTGYGITDGLVLDLGCGTGNMTRLLCLQGYDMIGVDDSTDMLMQARQKAMNEGMDILYLQQDMRSFELYGTVRAVVSVCDCVNYITDPQDLRRVFSLVNNYLDPGGIFIFDMNTQYKYRHLLGDKIIAESREDCGFIWENAYDETAGLNIYELSVFVRADDEVSADDESSEGEPFIRYRETHVQRAYSLAQMERLLTQAGLVFVQACDSYTGQPVRADSERICIIAREHGKEEKNV